MLKLLQKSYHGKIKMIYIDPPYNTGKDFVYKDDFRDNLKNYLEVTGQLGEEGQKLSTNSDSNGRYHSDWLNMMYPRLKLARNLLTDDGAIFISIDDNEQENLKKICDEIFGESNFITKFIRKGSGGRQDSKYYAIVHEYFYCYSKNIEEFSSGKLIKEDENYPFYDDNKKRNYKTQLLRKWGENSKRSDRPNLFYPILNPDGEDFYPMLNDKEEGCWRWGKDTMKLNIEKGMVEFKKKDNKWIAYEKIYEPLEGEEKTKLYSTVIDDIANSTGAKLLKLLFEDVKIFDYPKPSDLISKILQIGKAEKNSIILDFFSGSATTAHAVMQLNAEDGGNRKYIMVQLPEPCDEKSEAYKAGYKNICEIGKERIRRAGAKIKLDESLPLENREKLDIDFKVFKLDSSNIKEWDSETEDLKQSLFDSIDNIKSDRTPLDVLYEIILKYGLELTVPIEENKYFYSIGGGTLLINLDKEINMEVIDSICEEYRNLLEIDEDFKTTVVLRDSAFKNDVEKTNAMKKLEQAGIKEVRSI